MKEIREEAERHRKAKLEKYGADEKACGGHIKRAHGGKVEHEGHPHEKKDKHLAKEIKHEAEEIERDHEGKKHGGHVKHRDMGGPIAAGGGSPRLGRGRKGAGKKGTNVNVMIGKPGGSDGPVGLPPALGAGPGGPAPMPPKPMPAMPPRPMPAPGGAPAGPMKRGGKVEHKEHEKKHHERHHEEKRREHHSGHRGH